MPVRLESDRELLDRYKTGDEAAFEVLYRRYRRRLWGMARRMGTDLQQAEDILVEALAAVRGEGEGYDVLCSVRVVPMLLPI